MFNKNNNKDIFFREVSLVAKHMLQMPKPAANYVPKWYKSDKLFINGSNDFMKSYEDQAEGTYKLCVPLVDSLTSGYMFVTTCDIIVTNDSEHEYNPSLKWKVDWSPVDMLQPEVLGNFPIPFNHSAASFRWNSYWQVITPKGYSLWVTHPSNRYDLPFTTINAFVDTDKHPHNLLFPFFIKNGFEGVIPEGTPIAQVLPVKRDIWKSEKIDYDPEKDFIDKNIMKTNLIRTYKNKFWSKKEYR
jgi:hypothetical protein